jgi:hypothetical protein
MHDVHVITVSSRIDWVGTASDWNRRERACPAEHQNQKECITPDHRCGTKHFVMSIWYNLKDDQRLEIRKKSDLSCLVELLKML